MRAREALSGRDAAFGPIGLKITEDSEDRGEGFALVVGERQSAPQSPHHLAARLRPFTEPMLRSGKPLAGAIQRPSGQRERKSGLIRQGRHVARLARFLPGVLTRRFSEHVGRQIQRVEHSNGFGAASIGKHAAHLVSDPLPADAAQFAGVTTNGVGGLFIDLKVEASGETNGPQRSQMIFIEALIRIANGAHESRPQVVQAAHKVDNPPLHGMGRGAGRLGLSRIGGRQRIKKERIDREIAPMGVAGGVGVADVIRPAPIRITAFLPECRDLDGVPAAMHQHDAEGHANLVGVSEKRPDLIGDRVGGDVIVLRMKAEEFITNAAAGEIRGKTGIGQPLHDVRRDIPRFPGPRHGQECTADRAMAHLE